MKLSTDIKGVTKVRVYGRIGQMAIEYDAPRRADGRRAYRVGACCWVAIARVSLGMQHVIGIW